MLGLVFWGGICSSRLQQRNMTLSHTDCRALVGQRSSGIEAGTHPTQLHDLSCLMWLASWKYQVTLTCFTCHVRSWSRTGYKKHPQAQDNPMYCTGDWVVKAKAREAALIGSHLRNGQAFNFQHISKALHIYILLFFFLQIKPCHVEFTLETD